MIDYIGKLTARSLDDFEISVFLTETTTRHSLLTKHKHFHDTAQTKLTSNNPAGHSLVHAASEAPIDVDVDNDDDPALTAILRREESDDYDAGAVLAEIPEAPGTHNPAGDNSGRPPKRARRNTAGEGGDPENGGRSDVEYIPGDDDDDPQDEDDDEDDDGLFVDPEERHGNMGLPPAKRRKGGTAAAAADEEGDGGRDDKKKLAMDISYEGFSIYGRVLCLVVKRRGDGSGSSSGGGGVTVPSGAGGGRGGNASAKTGGQGQAMMENFIISTQVPAGMEAQ